MFRNTCILATLVVSACAIDAKYNDYARVLENPEFEQMLRLFAPEKMFTISENTWQAYTLNSSCLKDLIELSDALTRSKKWALKMLDASSKPPFSGLLQGNLVDLGQEHECQAESSDTRIRGHLCTYSFGASLGNVTLPVNPTLSICAPATCTDSDVVEFFRVFTSKGIEGLVDLHVNLLSATCSFLKHPAWDFEFIVCLIILLGFIGFLIVCTIMDVDDQPSSDRPRRGPLVDTLALFSLRRSAASILSMKVKKETLPAIHGIRSLSATMVVLVHEYYFTTRTATSNSLDLIEWSQNWRSLYIFIARLAFDTFLALSGLLTTYLFFKKMSRKKQFNIPLYYLHRYFRLTPAVLALMILAIAFVPKLGSGSRWDSQLSVHITSCQTKWWPVLLYLQNYVDKENFCLQHLWYLAIDMQFFWMSPLILYPLYRKPKFGLMLLTALLFASLVIPASIIGIKKLPVMSYKHENNATIEHEIYRDVYFNSYYRAGPWLIGVFLGYEVAMYDRRLDGGFAAAGWVITIASFAFCVFGQASFMDPDYEYNAVWESFYWAAKEPIWALGVCWIIYACIKNQAGYLSSILSSRIFLPFSRLSYGIYLVHFVLIVTFNAGLKTPIYFSEYYLWRSFITTLGISIGVAFLFTMVFEAPIVVLKEILRITPKSEWQSDCANELGPSGGSKAQPFIRRSTPEGSVSANCEIGLEPNV